MRVFCSELKWGGNGEERKRKFRSKKSVFFVFLFPGKVERRLIKSEKRIQESDGVFGSVRSVFVLLKEKMKKYFYYIYRDWKRLKTQLFRKKEMEGGTR